MKNIKGYEDLYCVTEEGSVFSLGNGNSNNSKFKELNPFKCGKLPNQYLCVKLCKNGEERTVKIHRLVAEAFIPNPEGFPTVNHRDKDTFNNHIDNLEWCTSQFNKEHGASKHYTLKSPDNEIISIFNLSKFCRDRGLSNGCIYHVLSGKYSQHKGWSLP